MRAPVPAPERDGARRSSLSDALVAARAVSGGGKRALCGCVVIADSQIS